MTPGIASANPTQSSATLDASPSDWRTLEPEDQPPGSRSVTQSVPTRSGAAHHATRLCTKGPILPGQNRANSKRRLGHSVGHSAIDHPVQRGRISWTTRPTGAVRSPPRETA